MAAKKNPIAQTPKELPDQLWKMIRLPGRPRLFETPEELAEWCAKYFQWCDDHPLYESKLVSFQGVSTLERVPKLRAYTIGGLTLFLGCSDTAWKRWRAGDLGEDFKTVCITAETAIREQKFAGAAADLLNPAIIARDLGLKDTVTNEHTSPDGTMSPSKAPLSDDDLKKELERRGLPANLLQE